MSQASLNNFSRESEAADFLGVRASTLRWWRYSGGGPAFVKMQGLVRYRRTDLEAYVTACVVEPRGTDTGRRGARSEDAATSS
jgi:hypothetical protein